MFFFAATAARMISACLRPRISSIKLSRFRRRFRGSFLQLRIPACSYSDRNVLFRRNGGADDFGMPEAPNILDKAVPLPEAVQRIVLTTKNSCLLILRSECSFSPQRRRG